MISYERVHKKWSLTPQKKINWLKEVCGMDNKEKHASFIQETGNGKKKPGGKSKLWL